MIKLIKKAAHPKSFLEGSAVIITLPVLAVLSFGFMLAAFGALKFPTLAKIKLPGFVAVPTHDVRLVTLQAPDVVGGNKSTGLQQVYATVQNDGNHVETVGVYLDVFPPSRDTNPGGCVPKGRIIETSVTIYPGQQMKVSVDTSRSQVRIVDFDCTNYSVVTGQHYTLIAAVDAHGDDLADCQANSLQSLACFKALADDDNDPWDNREFALKPQVQ